MVISNNIATVEFADLNLTDYNAPILGSAAPRDARRRALWRSGGLPLIDISAALSWRGSPYGLCDQVARAVRNHPRLDVWLKRAFGKPLSREEN